MRHIALILTLLISQSTLAAPQAQAAHCGNTRNTPELNECEFKLYEATDRDLNIEYKQTRARLSASAQAKLRKEQRAWIKRRDAHCHDLLRGEEGTSGWTSFFFQCQAKVTRERTIQLRAWKH